MAHKLSQYTRVVLYGAGNIAEKIYEGLLKCNISISFCVVTEKSENFFMGSIPIYELKECKAILQDSESIILVAVSKQYELEIENILKESGIRSWIRFSDFTVGELLEEYRDKSAEQCLEEVAEWKVVNSGDDWKDFEQIKKKIEEDVRIKDNENKILFVIGDLTPRVLKIIKALQYKNREVKVLLHPMVFFRQVCEEEFLQLGIIYRKCKCIEELIYNIIKEHVKIVHIFSHCNNTIIPYVLIKMRSILPCLVYDEYDIINEFYIDYPVDWLKEERYCLENADGICNRGYELEYLKQYGYSFKGKTIHFFDYCKDDDYHTDILNDKDELSICYAGGVITEKEYPDSAIVCWMDLLKRCEKAHCHLHIYPSEWSESNYTEYIELGKHNEFFHFHRPVSSEKLKKELSRYDYGIHPVRANYMEQEHIAYIKREKLIYAVTNHFYDYLDAGIPIIAATPVLFISSFLQKGVLLPWTIEEYDFDFLRNNKIVYRKRVEKIRLELQIKNHINELIDFYSSL